MPTDPPNDVATGGLDFECLEDVEKMKAYLGELSASGVRLLLHFAPPCATFSRARDRSWKTRLRSTQRPQGLLGRGAQCRVANTIARRTLDLLEYAVEELGAAASMENPRSSYLWSYLDFRDDLVFEDFVFSPCRFGASYMKPTRLRCWGWSPSVLDDLCTKQDGVWKCGREQHEVLEFGGGSTAQAAACHPEVCRFWAMEVRDYFDQTPTINEVIDEATVHDQGRVHRHRLRGGEQESRKERHQREDQASTAGMRNPGDLEKVWPQLWHAMADVKRLFVYIRTLMPELFVGLSACCGANPSRPPPSDEDLSILRRSLEKLLGAERGAFDKSSPASTWRYELVDALQKKAHDPDRCLPTWLNSGAPMGISEDIQPGGHFPRVESDAVMSVETLDKLPAKTENHPSWEELHGHDRPPAFDLIQEQVESGFALLFKDQASAEAALGAKVHPAPMGNVAKQKEDGSWKFRAIQDLRANQVNATVRLPERQVLPRGVDHGKDMARLQASMVEGEVLRTLILDFKDAFMSIPLSKSEWRFNCANTGFALRRAREDLYDGEPRVGTFVVWRVLGFGGRPNPLVFSRAASFACRCAQALLGPASREERQAARHTPPCKQVAGEGAPPFKQVAGEGAGQQHGNDGNHEVSHNDWSDIAYGRLQLYVDDPALTLRGTPDQIQVAMDVVMMFWLALGVPLAWKKGETFAQHEPHRWIGIVYASVPEGALLRLPPDYVAELLKMIDPLCSPGGSVSFHDLDIIVGKAARVAHVIPAAKPFIAGLWGALAGSRRAAATGQREAPPGRAPTRRFCYSASWIRALLREDPEFPFPLERLITPGPPPSATRSGWWIEFDASPFGGGAILKNPDGNIERYFAVVWDGSEAVHLGVRIGEPAFQTFWEFCTLLLSLVVWGKHFTQNTVIIYGDNTAALANALNLKGRGILLHVAREIAWRQARRGWKFETAHLPSEHNSIADALSRITDPKGKQWPSLALSAAEADTAPRLSELWLAHPV